MTELYSKDFISETESYNGNNIVAILDFEMNEKMEIVDNVVEITKYILEPRPKYTKTRDAGATLRLRGCN